jgi:amino acid permease
VIFGFTSTLAAAMLVKSGLQENIFSYPMLTERVLGAKAKLIVDVMIGLAQYSFTVSHISFVM